MKLSNNRFIKNTSWLLSGSIVRMLIQFVVSVLSVRYLGPSNFGVINYVAAYTAFFTALCGMGLNGIIISEFVNYREHDGEILGTAVVMRLAVGVVSSLAFILLMLLIDGSDKTIMMVTVLQAVQLPFCAFDTVKYWYQYQLRSKHEVFITTIGIVITSVYKACLLISKKGVEWFAFATSLDIILLAVMYLFSYHKHGIHPMVFSKDVAKRILKACGPFILANIMVFIYGKIDTIMIKNILGSTTLVGLYSAAITICGYISFVPTAILDSARPIVMNVKKKNEELYQIRFRQMSAGVLWISILYSLFISMFGEKIILLLYGGSYIGAVNSLKIAVWYTGFSYLGGVKSIWLICENKNKYVFVLSAMGAATNILLNLLLISPFGIEGAATATLITQILSNMIYPAFFKETRGFAICAKDALLLRNIHLKTFLKEIRSN